MLDHFIFHRGGGRVDERGDPRQAEPHRGLHHHRRDSHHRPQPRHNLFQFPSRRGGAVPGRHTAFRGPRRLAGRVGAGGRAPDRAARLRRHRLQVRHKGQPGLVAPDPGRRTHRKQCGQPALLGLPAASRHPGPLPKPPGALDRQSRDTGFGKDPGTATEQPATADST